MNPYPVLQTSNPVHGSRSGWVVGAMLLLAGMAGCVATPPARTLSDGGQIVVEGRVSHVDRAPWAYDGDGLLVLDTLAHGKVTVHLAARRNLCQAQGLDLFNTATVGMQVQASGTAIGPAAISVCGEATHYLKMAR